MISNTVEVDVFLGVDPTGRVEIVVNSPKAAEKIPLLFEMWDVKIAVGDTLFMDANIIMVLDTLGDLMVSPLRSVGQAVH